MRPLRHFSLLLLLALGCYHCYGSHLLGGEMTYLYQGDTTVGVNTLHKYQITLVIFQDCIHGQPEAITQDNPAYISIFPTGSSTPVLIDTSLYYSSSSLLTPTVSGGCGVSAVSSYTGCTMKKTFIRTYLLPVTTGSYTVSYQRCCRVAGLLNLDASGDNGVTYFCTIPGTTVNTSAQFTNDPPQLACIHVPIHFDQSATDTDGDSLTYELCPAYKGGSDANIKPIPSYPSDLTSYATIFSSSYPLTSSPAIVIDAHTGLITGTPTIVGRYMLSWCCTEWRAGVVINVQRREIVITVTDCGAFTSYAPDAGHDTVIFVGAHIPLHGSSAVSYDWSPGSYLDDSTIAGPTGYFPTPGTFPFVLHGISDSGCVGTDTVNVIVLEHSTYAVPNAFTPDNDGHNDVLSPFNIEQATLVNFRIYDHWGKLVHEGTPFNTGWDGRYHGVLQQPGVYFWSLQYIDNHGATQVAKGNVTLLR